MSDSTVMMIDHESVAASCGQIGLTVSGLEGDTDQFRTSFINAASVNAGSAADAARRFTDLGHRTVATGLVTVNNTRTFMGEAALEIAGLDTRLGRATFGSGQGPQVN